MVDVRRVMGRMRVRLRSDQCLQHNAASLLRAHVLVSLFLSAYGC